MGVKIKTFHVSLSGIGTKRREGHDSEIQDPYRPDALVSWNAPGPGCPQCYIGTC